VQNGTTRKKKYFYPDTSGVKFTSVKSCWEYYDAVIKQNISKQVNDAVLEVTSSAGKGMKPAQKPEIYTKAENTSKKRKHGESENSPRKTESLETPGFKAMKYGEDEDEPSVEERAKRRLDLLKSNIKAPVGKRLPKDSTSESESEDLPGLLTIRKPVSGKNSAEHVPKVSSDKSSSHSEPEQAQPVFAWVTKDSSSESEDIPPPAIKTGKQKDDSSSGFGSDHLEDKNDDNETTKSMKLSDTLQVENDINDSDSESSSDNDQETLKSGQMSPIQPEVNEPIESGSDGSIEGSSESSGSEESSSEEDEPKPEVDKAKFNYSQIPKLAKKILLEKMNNTLSTLNTSGSKKIGKELSPKSTKKIGKELSPKSTKKIGKELSPKSIKKSVVQLSPKNIIKQKKICLETKSR